MKSIVSASVGLFLFCAACTESAPPPARRTADAQELMRRKSIRSQYIAKVPVHEPKLVYPQLGEYRNYGLVEVPPAAIASARPTSQPASDFTPTGAHRSVINQVTNEPVR